MTQPIVVLGAGGGVGYALAKRLSDVGEDLFLTARDEADMEGLSGQKNVLDITDADAVADILSRADQGEGVKGFAYCIGSIDLKPLKATKDDDFLASFDRNVLGAVRALRALEKPLKVAGGSVVLFSTVAVQHGFPSHSIISAAKGAVEGMTRALAAEWAPHVRVNAIAPSLLDTKMAKSLTTSEQMRKGIEKMHPIPRLGQADDVAAMAAFLLRDDAGWVTGQVFGVDGGRSGIAGKG